VKPRHTPNPYRNGLHGTALLMPAGSAPHAGYMTGGWGQVRNRYAARAAQGDVTAALKLQWVLSLYKAINTPLERT
jgi:hypothetical protein